jgi:hypothetical protein
MERLARRMAREIPREQFVNNSLPNTRQQQVLSGG